MEVTTEFAKLLAPNRLALSRQTTTLRVCEAYPPAFQLLTTDAILLDEILDHRHLVTIHPAGHGHLMAYSVHRDGYDRGLVGDRRVCETHADESPDESEGSLAPRVGGIDVEPPIAEANPDGGVVRLLLGGTDHDDSPFLWHRQRDGLDDSGLEVMRRDLDGGPEYLEYLPGRSRLQVYRRDGTANRHANRQ